METPLLSTLQQRIQSAFDVERILYYAKIEVDYHATLKNGKRAFTNPHTGKTHITHKKGIPEAKSHMVHELRKQAIAQRLNEPIEDDVWVLMFFWFKDYYISNGSRRSKRIGDLDNLICLPLDSIQKANIISDDSQVCSLDLCRRLPSADGKNSLEIYILKHEEPER